MRFGLVWRGDGSLVEAARRAEDAGYATLLFPDHTGSMAPLPAMAAAAAATSRLRVGTQVINIAFRPLGALAQEAAAVDVLSGGRLEVGLGAGYAEPEVRSLGLPFPGAATRIREVARALDVLPRLFAGETVTEDQGPGRLAELALAPLPPQGAAVPLMAGGNGDRMLEVAARGALDSPFLLLGPVDAICDQLQELRERFGISYVTVLDGRSDGFEQVVARLA